MSIDAELPPSHNGTSSAAMPTAIHRDEGTPLWIMGDQITIKITAEQTGGAFAVWENTTPPGAGSPPHIHNREDEAFHVLEGTFEFMLEGRLERAGPGTLVYVPRGVPHMFRNVSDAPARALVWVTPGGFERFFLEVGRPASATGSPADAGPPDMDGLLAAAGRHALEVMNSADAPALG
ncbi:MAG: quercetin 2,3-dioxygenase [Gemmatimonadetes bacterium]|nr:quercetin 2,3-dioxygenase [Gemmatimonadota bacterium]